MSAISIRRCTAIAATAVVMLILWLLVEDFGAITSRDLGTDASQNVSSINLVRHGVYSMQPISRMWCQVFAESRSRIFSWLST